jgi:hypothetical protein
MAGRIQRKMHGTTNYQGRSVEMNISKNKYVRSMEKKENVRSGKMKRK